MRRLSIVVCAVAIACSAKTPGAVVLRATAGLDGAPFAGDPPIVRVELRVRAQTGTETTIATTTPSSGALDVPDSVRTTGGVGALALAGLDSGGALLAYGRTPDVELAGIAQSSVDFSILVQRVGSLHRALRLPHATSARPIVVPYGPRFVLVADASNGALERIDLLSTSAAAETVTLPGAPATIATAGDVLLSIDAAGNASILHPGDTAPTTPTPPPGASFADVAGGAVFVGDDEAAYVVGATRSTPSDVVLRIGTDGSIAARHLKKARSGAAATWIPGQGLVVMGGDAIGGALPPELLAASATDSQPLSAFPTDATKGALLAFGGSSKVVRVGSTGAIDVFDLSCTASPCSPVAQSASIAGTARSDDALVSLERGGFLVVRGGSASLLDDSLSKTTPLGDLGASIGLARVPTGFVAIVVAGDDVVRTLY